MSGVGHHLSLTVHDLPSVLYFRLSLSGVHQIFKVVGYSGIITSIPNLDTAAEPSGFERLYVQHFYMSLTRLMYNGNLVGM